MVRAGDEPVKSGSHPREYLPPLLHLCFTAGMSEAVAEVDRLTLKFDGPAVDEHRIDVRDLAPSLLALADLYATAHRLAGDELALPPALDVHANGEGSFLVDLFLYFKHGEATDLLTGANVLATVTGIQLIEWVTHALRWSLLRFRLGREVTVVESVPEPGMIRVTWAAGDSIECPIEAQSLVESMDFNRTAGRVFEPLRRPGITSMDLGRVEDPSRSLVRVHAGELAAFNTLDNPEDIVSDNSRRIVVTIENLAFKPRNKWKIHDGTGGFWASITDLEFAQRFAAGEELFANGDTLLVSLRDVQYRNPDKTIRVEHYIEKVHEHRRREDDEPLDFSEDPPADDDVTAE